MHADLVRAAGQRLDRQPGEFLAGGVDHDEIGDGIFRALVRRIDGGHALVAAARAMAAFLGKRRLDRAALDLRHALDQRPVDLLRVAGGQRARQLGGGGNRARHDEDAGGVAVQAMDEARARVLLESEAVEHAVDMGGEAAAALGRQARRLVQHDDVLVHVDDVVLQTAADLLLRLSAGLLFEVAVHHLRRQADHLAGGDAVGRLHPLAVEPDLPGAQQLLQPAMGQRRVVPLEPAVDADAVLVMGDAGGVGHVRARAPARVRRTALRWTEVPNRRCRPRQARRRRAGAAPRSPARRSRRSCSRQESRR